MTSCRVCQREFADSDIMVKEMMFGFEDEFAYKLCEACCCLQIVSPPDSMEKYYPSNYYSLISDGPSLRFWLMKLRDCGAIHRRNLFGIFLSWIFPNRSLNAVLKLENSRLLRLLDVGSGQGAFVESLIMNGYKNVYGLDPYLLEDRTINGEKRILRQGIFEINGEWDCITFNHSFEHLPDPEGVLRKVYELLSANGVCILRVPVVDSFAWKRYQDKWFNLDAPRHYFLHSSKSIQALAKKVGLELKDIYFDSKAIQFWGSEQYASGVPLYSNDSLQCNKLLFVKSIHKILWYKLRSIFLNKKGLGDQAVFYLFKS